MNEQQDPKARMEQAKKKQEAVNARLEKIKHIILILSGKGGVGKSTIAANLAFALAEKGKKVGLLDIDIHGPSIPGILGLENQRIQGAEGHLEPIEYTPNLKVISIGFLLSENDSAVIWRGPLKHQMIHQFIADVNWGDLDYLVVDSPPGTGDEPLSIAQLLRISQKNDPNSGAVIVTTPQRVSITDVRKCVTFCRQLQLPILGVVENMSGFVCPKCGERVDLFKSGGGKTMAEEMDIPFLEKIPIDPDVVDACDKGEPYLSKYAKSPAAEAFGKIVQTLHVNE
jgi:ATP-binding protein involved in chromosome partitioning